MSICPINYGYLTKCKTTAGIQRVWLTEYNGSQLQYILDDSEPGINSSYGTIIGFTGSLPTLYEFEQNLEVASYTETGSFSNENQTAFYTGNLMITLNGLRQSIMEQIKQIGRGRWRVFILDQNGNYWLMGKQNDVNCIASTPGFGKGYGDLYGATITLESKEPRPITQISSEAFQQLIPTPPTPPQFEAKWYPMLRQPEYVIASLYSGLIDPDPDTFILTNLVVNGVELITGSPYISTLDETTLNIVTASNTITLEKELNTQKGYTYTNFVDLLNQTFEDLGMTGYKAQLSLVENYYSVGLYTQETSSTYDPNEFNIYTEEGFVYKGVRNGFYIIYPKDDIFSIYISNNIADYKYNNDSIEFFSYIFDEYVIDGAFPILDDISKINSTLIGDTVVENIIDTEYFLKIYTRLVYQPGITYSGSFYLNIDTYTETDMTIDYGDGTTNTISGTTSFLFTHNYDVPTSTYDAFNKVLLSSSDTDIKNNIKKFSIMDQSVPNDYFNNLIHIDGINEFFNIQSISIYKTYPILPSIYFSSITSSIFAGIGNYTSLNKINIPLYNSFFDYDRFLFSKMPYTLKDITTQVGFYTDNILIYINNLTTELNGYIDTRPTAAVSGPALAAKANLISNGWTILP